MSGPSVFVGRFIPSLQVVPCNLKFVQTKVLEFGMNDASNLVNFNCTNSFKTVVAVQC